MIKVYYHIYTSSHKILGLMFVDQQLRRLYVSGLHNYAQLNCVIHGPHYKDIEELVNRYGGWRILESRSDDPEGLCETRTLKHLRQEVQADDDFVLFLHTKGIAYHTGEKRIHGFTLPRNLRAINSWRFALEYFCIDQWQDRLQRLANGADTESAFLNLDPYWNYAGNIWWTRGLHLKRLPDPTTMEGIEKKHAARSWLFYYKGLHMSLFHVLDKTREDGRYEYGTFRLHEDDLMPHLLEDRRTNHQERQQILSPEIMDILERNKRYTYNDGTQ